LTYKKPNALDGKYVNRVGFVSTVVRYEDRAECDKLRYKLSKLYKKMLVD